MPAFIDLTGREVGKWRVLRRDPARGPGAWWVCQCAPDRGGCGRIKSVQGGSLRRSQSTQCRACQSRGNDHAKGKPRTAAHKAAISMALSGRRRAIVHHVCARAGCGAEYRGAPHHLYCSPACRPSTSSLREPKPKKPKEPKPNDRRRGPRHPERDAIARELRAEGKTLREIGDALGLTRERVRQILARSHPAPVTT